MAKIIDRTNEKRLMKNGLKAKIVAYRKYEDIDIQFEDGVIVYNKNYGSFKSGTIGHPTVKTFSKLNQRHFRLGETRVNSCGTKIEIIRYNNYEDIDVLFHDEHNTTIKNTRYCYFDRANIYSPYDKTICNIGYLGDAYTTDVSKEKSYGVWSDMIIRCYADGKNHSTYKDCFVCDEWHNYSNFKKWYNENYYEINGQSMNLDKDILIKGNKIYSPDTCMFVPKSINVLFVKANKIRGDLPIGVHHDYNRNCYAAKLSIKNKTKALGRFADIEEAFGAYKQAKEQYIKNMADEYKDLIPDKLYDAMYKYEVDIAD